MDRLALARIAADLGLELSEAQITRFAEFEAALYEANEVMNLTRVLPEECLTRHFVDSLLLLRFIPVGASVLDIGTGPGFPSWPLACARPDLTVTALDSSGKMLKFLRTQPLPNLRTVQARAEELLDREGYDFVTGRAVAPLPIQLEISAAQCRLGGVVVPMRTPSDDFDDVDPGVLGLRLDRVETVPLPDTEIVRAFPVYEKRSLTPKRFPRRWADIRTTPLFRLPSAIRSAA